MDTLESSTVGTGYSTEPQEAPQTTTEPVGKGTWYEGIDKNIYDDPSLRAFKDEKGSLNGQNLLKSYVHAQKTLGRDRHVLPTDKDSPEIWKEFYSKMGMPKDLKEYSPIPSEYEIADEQLYNSFKETAFQAGLLPKQAQQLLEWYARNEELTDQMTQQTQAREVEQSIATLKQDFGQAFEGKVMMAQRAVQELASPELVELLESTGAGNNPAVVKFFASLGEALMEDSPTSQSGATGMKGSMAPDEAQAEINKIMADMNHPYFNKDNAQHEDAVRKMNRLFEMLG